MATRRWGISKGEGIAKAGVTEAVGAAVAADGVELTVDLALNYSRQDVLDAVTAIHDAIMAGNWPPA